MHFQNQVKPVKFSLHRHWHSLGLASLDTKFLLLQTPPFLQQSLFRPPSQHGSPSHSNGRTISHLFPSKPSLHSHLNSWAPFTSEQDFVFRPTFFLLISIVSYDISLTELLKILCPKIPEF